jgi:hypothetical protein
MTHTGESTGADERAPMANPSTATLARVDMCRADVLLATKLHVPGPRPGFVPRPRLVAALDEGLARGRVLVCAPAGFGKTALLAGSSRLEGRGTICRSPVRLAAASPVPWNCPRLDGQSSAAHARRFPA